MTAAADRLRQLADGPGSALLLWGLQNEDEARLILHWCADTIGTLGLASNVLECEGPDHRGCRLTIENNARALLARLDTLTEADE